MGRESLSANSEANHGLWELTPHPLEKSVPSLVLSTVDIFPFQKLHLSLFFLQLLDRAQVLLGSVG